MNGSLTMLAFAMVGLGGVTSPEHIPPAPVPASAYQGLDCVDLMRAAETVDADLADAWDHQELLARHRFGAPPTIVRRSEAKVAQLKGELETIWRVADQKSCGDSAPSQDLAWAPGREPGPMLGEPRERDAFGPEEQLRLEAAGPEAEADEPGFDTGADEPDPVDQAAIDDDQAGPTPEEPAEVEGYGGPEPQARDAGPARWPSTEGRPASPVTGGQSLDDVDWPKAD